jgi:DNA polymerase-4
VRLIGVSLAGLGDEPPPGLFDDPGTSDDEVEVTGPRPVDDEVDRLGVQGAPPVDTAVQATLGGAGPARDWRAGDDVVHLQHGHGWVQGAGHGRVTVRFETRSTGPGRARTLAADDPALRRGDPMGSLR